jgi:SAM-dependent methyltransferase
MTDTPSPWIERFAPMIRPGGSVLDLAAGGGRHTRYLAELGYRVVAVDVDVSRLIDLGKHPGVEILERDLEAEPWPFDDRGFDGVVVANYLHRPLLPRLTEVLSPGGILIYETFAEGNAEYGRPSNPAFLLRDGELLEAFSGSLEVIAYEHGFFEEPRPAVRQRICARK